MSGTEKGTEKEDLPPNFDELKDLPEETHPKIEKIPEKTEKDRFRAKVSEIISDIDDLEYQLYELKKEMHQKRMKLQVLKDEKTKLLETYYNFNNISDDDFEELL